MDCQKNKCKWGLTGSEASRCLARASCVTLSNLLSLSEPPFPHLQHADLIIFQVCSNANVLRLHGIFH